MNCDEIIRNRIAELEQAQQKAEKKLTPGPNAVKYALEAEKYRFAIQEL